MARRDLYKRKIPFLKVARFGRWGVANLILRLSAYVELDFGQLEGTSKNGS